jgi:hypothetical protein
MPFRRVARRLDVSPSSVVEWTRDITLTEEQIARNLRDRDGPLNPEAMARRAAAWSARCRARRAEYQHQGRMQARRGDPLHLQGCMLYWAEGGKGRNQLNFSNSDVQMQRLFRRFLTESLRVDRSEIRLRVNAHLNNGLTIGEIERHWLIALELPQTCVRKHTVNCLPKSSSGRRHNRLPYGVATLSVSSTRVVQHIFGAIQEYGGFSESRWLD